MASKLLAEADKEGRAYHGGLEKLKKQSQNYRPW